MDLAQESEIEAADELKPRAGRPRSTAADEAIIMATTELLIEVGYRAMCMEAVAARAGVSKATLYRRYKDKEALVTDTILLTAVNPPSALPPMPESPREAMLFMVRTAAVTTSRPAWLPILGAMLSEGPHAGGLAAAMREQIFEPSKEMLAAIVLRGIAGGELSPSLCPEVVNDVLFGALVVRAMLGEEMNDEWVEELVDLVWRGFGASSGEPMSGTAPLRPIGTGYVPKC